MSEPVIDGIVEKTEFYAQDGFWFTLPAGSTILAEMGGQEIPYTTLDDVSIQLTADVPVRRAAGFMRTI